MFSLWFRTNLVQRTRGLCLSYLTFELKCLAFATGHWRKTNGIWSPFVLSDPIFFFLCVKTLEHNGLPKSKIFIFFLTHHSYLFFITILFDSFPSACLCCFLEQVPYTVASFQIQKWKEEPGIANSWLLKDPRHSVKSWFRWLSRILNVLLLSIGAFIWLQDSDLISKSLTQVRNFKREAFRNTIIRGMLCFKQSFKVILNV